MIVDENLEVSQLPALKEGSLIPVQVSQVNSVSDLYVCTHPLDDRDRLQEDLDRFYKGGDGRGWVVANARPGRLYAAPYEKEGFHRALVRKLVPPSAVELFYVDFGTIAVVSASKLRLLHLDFLHPPALAIRVRLWGLQGRGKSKLLGVLREGNQREGDLLARVEVDGDKPAVWLVDNTVEGGKSLNVQLVEEGAAKWNLRDLEAMDESTVKNKFETEEDLGGAMSAVCSELEGLVELQTALVNLMMESNLKTTLISKLAAVKVHLVGRTKNKPEESNALVKGGYPKKSCKESDRNGRAEKQIIDVRSMEPELEYFAENQGSEISVPSTRENSSKSEEEKVLMKSRLTSESEGLSAEEDGVVTLRPRLAKRKA